LGPASIAWASDYDGQVTFGGLAVPGATITATQGEKKFTVTSDDGGRYRFDDLPDGKWTMEITLQCFAPIRADVAITPHTAPGKWELTLLPIQELMALARQERPDAPAQSTLPATPEGDAGVGAANAP